MDWTHHVARLQRNTRRVYTLLQIAAMNPPAQLPPQPSAERADRPGADIFTC